MSTTVTPAIAQAEIARRALPKGNRPRPTSQEAFRMSGADLRAIVGTPAPTAPKATAKVGKAKGRVQNPHTHLRNAASAVKRAYWHHTGENMTYTDACAVFGTAPAREGLDTRPVSRSQAAKATLALKDPAAFVAEVLV